jgi:hypothetical protein
MGNTGDTLLDATGRFRNATLNGGLLPDWDSTYPYGGWGLNFDGSNDYVSLTSGCDFEGPLTFSAWIKHDANGSELGVILCGSSTTTADLFVQQGWTSETKFGWGSYTLGGGTNQGTGWKHYVFVRGGTTGAWTANISSAQPLEMGRVGAGGYYSGRIMNPALWERALNADEACEFYLYQMEMLLPIVRVQGMVPVAAGGNKLLLRMMEERLFIRGMAA